MTPNPTTGHRGATERIHERSPDPAEAANRPLEPKSSQGPLASRDEPAPATPEQPDPHHRLNTPVGEPDPTADSDPYRQPTVDDEADRASGVRGRGEGAER
jgi:hypothetical protein